MFYMCHKAHNVSIGYFELITVVITITQLCEFLYLCSYSCFSFIHPAVYVIKQTQNHI